jgi:hypothetical protein
MLRTEEITPRIGDVLVAKLGISPDSVVEVANIEVDLGAASLDMVETICRWRMSSTLRFRIGMLRALKLWATLSRL